MKVKLTKDARINMQAGSVIDVPEPVYRNLVSLGVCVPVAGDAETPKKRRAKKRRATKTK